MYLRTLGGLRLDGVDFTRPKPLLLLTYLTVEGAQSRRVVAELFFGHTRDPRDSLSTAIRHFRDLEAEIVTVDGDRLAARVDCDTTGLLEARDAGLLEPVLELYGGPFLSGLDLDLGEELEEWVFTTREYLAAQVREAHLRVGELLRTQDAIDRAVRHAEAAMELTEAPPLTPELLDRLHALLGGSNSPMSRALEQTARDFGIEFSESPQVGATHSAQHSIPAEHSSFVGRSAERLILAKYLSDSETRLVTLHGPGGIGKSRLAKRVARDQLQTDHFPDGVFFIELEAVPTIERAPEAIASVLGMELSEKSEPMAQVRSALAKARSLLVLDGFEHLTQDADWVCQLIDDTAHTKILVTSRTRLNVVEEHVLTLSGLSSPRIDDGPEAALASDAVQLLVQRGKKSMLDFVLKDADIPEAVSLCTILEGSPLAIELAMAWIRTMSLSEIRREMEIAPAFLDASVRNLPEKHRGMRAVFERSYRLLRPAQQDAIAKLAVFRGGFRREAAASVADATLPMLVQLTDASLIRPAESGRYSLHALVHQYASEQLAQDADSLAAVRDAHAEYFRAYTSDLLAQMYTESERAALDALDTDLANILQAWDRIFENELDVASEFPTQLVVFFDRLGLFWEGIRFFRRSSTALQRLGLAEGDLMSEILANLAWLHFRIGAMDESEALATKAIATGSPKGRGRMMASNIIGAVLQEVGRDAEAIEHLEEAVRIATSLGMANRAAMYLINLATAKKTLLDHDGAELDLLAAIRVAKRENYPFLIVMAKNNLANLIADAGNLGEAGRLFQDSLELAESVGYTTMRPILLANLADNLVDRGNVERARTVLRDASAASSNVSDEALRALVLDVEGRIALREGKVAEAERQLLESLAHAMQHLQDKRHLKILVHLSEVWIEREKFDLALEALHYVEPRVRHLEAVLDRVRALVDRIPTSLLEDDRVAGDQAWRPEFVLDRLANPGT